MRLSEAILLGSTMITPMARVLLTEDGTAGCAFGMALRSIGAKGEADVCVVAKTSGWQWVKEPLGSRPTLCACGTEDDLMLLLHNTVQARIAHIFNEHVATDGDGTVTLEQLADYVRSIEPPEVEVAENEPASSPSEVATSCADRG